MAQIWPENPNWANILGFGPFCLDLGHIAWIWAIWLKLGQNRPQRRQSPEDGAGEGGRMDVQIDIQTEIRMYRWTDRFPLCSTGLLSLWLWGRCPKRVIGFHIRWFNGQTDGRMDERVEKVNFSITHHATQLARNRLRK